MKSVRINKYLAFDRSVHQTMGILNSTKVDIFNPSEVIVNILRKSWVSEGYNSLEEENKFKIRAYKMLVNYFYDPLDKGTSNVIIDKVVGNSFGGKEVLATKVDKVYERVDGRLEVIDYKSGYVIRHSNDFPIELKSALFILLIYYRLGVYPKFISFYYLSYNRKFTRTISEHEIDEAYNIVDDAVYRKKQRKINSLKQN